MNIFPGVRNDYMSVRRVMIAVWRLLASLPSPLLSPPVWRSCCVSSGRFCQFLLHLLLSGGPAVSPPGNPANSSCVSPPGVPVGLYCISSCLEVLQGPVFFVSSCLEGLCRTVVTSAENCGGHTVPSPI
eukprot:1159318-Pelagomonas_calceolata.AAC.3